MIRKWQSLLILGFTIIGILISANFVQANQTINGRQIQLHGTTNTFDLGGIRAKNGQKIKSHLLIRSDALSRLTKRDRWRLSHQIKVRTIADFRSAGEIHQSPDKRIAGANNHRLSIMADPHFGVHSTRQYARQLAAKQPNNMKLFYQKMVTNPHAIRAYRTLFRYLLHHRSGAILYHCTYGKDRTGVATMLILSSLGVPKTTILKNYQQSNRTLKKSNHRAWSNMRRVTHNRRALQNLARSQAANPSYLNAAYSIIRRSYGSMHHYLNVKMHLSNHQIIQLRHHYLQPEK